MQCICSVTRNCVFISDEDHIIERHFNPSPNDAREPRRGFFLRDVFADPEDLFAIILDPLRKYLQPDKKSGDCYEYYLEFPFDVGYFPYRREAPYHTNIVKGVCRYITCQYCFKHCPSTVTTVYPWLPKNQNSDQEELTTWNDVSLHSALVLHETFADFPPDHGILQCYN